MTDVPEALVPLSWLIGRWVGVGLGTYPTIEDFRFGQEVVFATDGRPFLTYRSVSWILDDDGNRVRPAATETGYWLPREDNRVEVLLTHPTGYVEMYVGDVTVTSIEAARIAGARVELHTDVIARSPSAKPYEQGHRLYGLIENGDLGWTYDMAAMEQPLINHLSAKLSPASQE